MLGLAVPDLWFDYMSLGGSIPPQQLNEMLSGRARLGDHDHDLLAQALNERFLDCNENHPLAYADELLRHPD